MCNQDRVGVYKMESVAFLFVLAIWKNSKKKNEGYKGNMYGQGFNIRQGYGKFCLS